MPRAAFTTLGCKVNQFETEAMEGLFKARGYQVVAFDQFADVYVINTCSVTHLGEKKSRQFIRRASRTNPAAIVAVTGCYAQVSPEQIEAIVGVDVIIGTQDRGRVVDLVEEAAASQQPINVVHSIMAAEKFEDIPLLEAPGRTRAFLKIQEGCTNFCTYCIIPYARGPLRSRPLESVMREVTKFVKAGFKEIVLTGIHLGAYGRDTSGAITLVDVVKAILSITGLIRLRLGSLESIEISDELINVMKLDSRLCRQLHLPLQAGDDTVLSAMNRQYTTAQYRQLIEQIRCDLPDIAISTDIIVGFPGETEAMFTNALTFVDHMKFSKIHIFPYSRRSGTPAADYPEQVPEEIKKHRVQEMQLIADKHARAFQARFIGQQMEILFEGDKLGIVEGLSSNYIRVYTAKTNTTMRTLEQVKLEKTYRDGLWGKIVE